MTEVPLPSRHSAGARSAFGGVAIAACTASALSLLATLAREAGAAETGAGLGWLGEHGVALAIAGLVATGILAVVAVSAASTLAAHEAQLDVALRQLRTAARCAPPAPDDGARRAAPRTS